MTTISDFSILAFNNAQSSENRIHSDEIAAKFGFKGALVSGANLFGYLSQPLVAHYRESWLQTNIINVEFIKPAYQDDLLTIKTKDLSCDSSSRAHCTYMYNAENQLLAKLKSSQPDQLPEVNQLAQIYRKPEELKRQEISWDIINENKPWPTYVWKPTQEDNLQRVSTQRDQCAIYQSTRGHIHPYYLLESCNKALMRKFIMPAWIHTGSRLILRKPLQVGQTIEIRTTPAQKWERKGHQFVKLYIAMLTDNTVALEAEHIAIFKIAI